MRVTYRQPIWLAVFLGAVLLAPGSLLACVGCREPGSQTVQNESGTVIAGFAFSWSVLFMLAFAVAVVALLAGYIWRTVLRLEEDRRRA
jgi:energy-converting hydrogenase Eha subunit E